MCNRVELTVTHLWSFLSIKQSLSKCFYSILGASSFARRPEWLSFVFGARALRDTHVVDFLGSSFARFLYGRVLSFFADFVICAHFSSFVANFSKPTIDTDTMFSLNVEQDARLHFHRKQNSKKVRLQTSSEKTRVLTDFHFQSPVSRDRIQSLWFRKFYKHFIGYILALNDVNFFSYLHILSNKHMIFFQLVADFQN